MRLPDHDFVRMQQIVLMKWNTAVVESIDKDSTGKVVGVTARYAPGGNFKKSAKLTWVCDSVRGSVVVVVVFPRVGMEVRDRVHHGPPACCVCACRAAGPGTVQGHGVRLPDHQGEA